MFCFPLRWELFKTETAARASYTLSAFNVPSRDKQISSPSHGTQNIADALPVASVVSTEKVIPCSYLWAFDFIRFTLVLRADV